MEVKTFFGFLFILLTIFLFSFYLFNPFSNYNFVQDLNTNSNFSLDGSSGSLGMQFYSNMRYPESKISYRIEDCPLYKQNDIKNAFDGISERTILEFYPVNSNEEISAFCSERSTKKASNPGLYVAGEGGPTNITQTDKFNVIFNGQITLIKESNCEDPKIAMHEIFHALGFDHSQNPKSIMYEVGKCDQEIGDDLINTINELYSFPSLPDLAFENVSASTHGKFLDVNVSIRNNGLKSSQDSELEIFADGKSVKTFPVNSLAVGYGTEIVLKNLLVPQFAIEEIEFAINSDGNELEETNNVVKLKIKNKN